METKAWNVEDSLRLVQAVQAEAKKYGYQVTIGGKVVTQGRSEDVLALFFLPANRRAPKTDHEGLRLWLVKIWQNYDYLDDIEPDYREEEVPDVPKVNLEGLGAPAQDRLLGAQIRVGGRFDAQPARRMRAEPMRAGNGFGEFVANFGDLGVGQMAGQIPVPQELPKPAFRHSLRFIRSGGDKIDVYIV